MALALTVSLPPLLFGYPQGHDWIFELVRVTEYYYALAGGQTLPFWGENLYRGFGSPIFLYYAPLYGLISSAFMAVGLTVKQAAIASLTLFAVCGAVGMTGLVREIIGRRDSSTDSAARVASAAFVLAPYFVANALVRNASAEFSALSIAPYAFWGLALLYRGKIGGMPLLAISIGLVILAHNLTSLVVTAGVAASSLVLLSQDARPGQIRPALGALALGLGMTCWFWLPALGMNNLVRIDQMTQGKFDFHQNFTQLSEIFGFGGPFAVGWAIPIVMLVGAAALAQKKKGNRIIGAALALALLLTFLQTAGSSFVWENIPLLPLFQFPWRLLGVLSIISAVMAGLLFHRYLSQFKYAEAIVLLIIALNCVPLIISFQPLNAENSQLVDKALNAEGIRLRGLPATVMDEYLPQGADKRVTEWVSVNASVIRRISTVSEIREVIALPTRFELAVRAASPSELHLARWHFPGWLAELNGKDYPVSADRFGMLMINLPAGEYELKIRLSQPPLRTWGIGFSGMSALILIVTILYRQRYSASSTWDMSDR